MKTTTQKLFLFLAALTVSLSAKALPLAEKEWTFLLFLNGHNNLSSFGDLNIKDMEKTGSTDQLNLVVEWGKSDDALTHRLLVQKSTDPSKVTSPTIMTLKDRDMGDYKSLVDFVNWGADNFPAKHYFVAVWNHGSGWHFQDAAKIKSGEIGINDISFDDNSGNKITTEQLGVAMAEIKQHIGRNIDIYGSDACLMQMVEVAAEMKNSVDYFVGSEDLEPGEGWPYPTFTQKWASSPQSTPAEVSVLLSKEYLKAYSTGGSYSTRSVTFSALDMSKLDAVIQSSKQLAAHIRGMGADSIKKIKAALSSVQGYYYSDYKDYGHFVKTIEALPVKKDAALFSKAKADLNSLVLSTDNSASFAKSTGMAIWFPSSASSDMARYKGLQFDRATSWSQLIETVIK